MAKHKKPSNETTEQATDRRKLESVANAANRSEKTSWNRKMDNMVMLIAKIRPIEDQIIQLIADKQPIMDEIAEMRSSMIAECIHPINHLTEHNGILLCKFCNKSIAVPGDDV